MEYAILSFEEAVRALRSPEGRRFTGVVSMGDPGSPKLPGYTACPTLRLEFHDVPRPRLFPGVCHPKKEHVREILEFGRLQPHGGRILVHCRMGVSRSSAAALILMVDRLPRTQESVREALERVLKIRPQAWPNALMAYHADALLGFEGVLASEVRDFVPPFGMVRRHDRRP